VESSFADPIAGQQSRERQSHRPSTGCRVAFRWHAVPPRESLPWRRRPAWRIWCRSVDSPRAFRCGARAELPLARLGAVTHQIELLDTLGCRQACRMDGAPAPFGRGENSVYPRGLTDRISLGEALVMRNAILGRPSVASQ